MGSYRPLVVCEIHHANTILLATNDGRTSPRFKVTHDDGNTSYSGHAEMRALAKLGTRVKRGALKIYVSRYRKDGSVGMAKPCAHCQAHLSRAGIKSRQIWFTNEQGTFTRLSHATNHP